MTYSAVNFDMLMYARFMGLVYSTKRNGTKRNVLSTKCVKHETKCVKHETKCVKHEMCRTRNVLKWRTEVLR